jgi:hypothetical protein
VSTFLVTLHVIAVVLVVGPMVVAPFFAGRMIARRSVEGVRSASNAVLAFSLGSVLAALLGALAVGTSDQVSFGTPWVIISMTVYLFVVSLALGYTAPAARRAARIISHLATKPPPLHPVSRETPATPPKPAPLAGSLPPDDDPTTAAMQADIRSKQRIDEIVGRVTGSGLLILAGVVLIVVLMVVKPFGA